MKSTRETNGSIPRYMQYRSTLSKSQIKDVTQNHQIPETTTTNKSTTNKNYSTSVSNSGSSNGSQNVKIENQKSYQSPRSSIRGEENSSIPRYMKYRSSLLQSQSHTNESMTSNSTEGTPKKVDTEASRLSYSASPISMSPSPRFSERKSGIPRFSENRSSTSINSSIKKDEPLNSSSSSLSVRQAGLVSSKNDTISPQKSNVEQQQPKTQYQTQQTQQPQPTPQVYQKQPQIAISSKESSSFTSTPQEASNQSTTNSIGAKSSNYNSRYAKYRSTLTKSVPDNNATYVSVSRSTASTDPLNHEQEIVITQSAPGNLAITNSASSVPKSTTNKASTDYGPTASPIKAHSVNGQLRPKQFIPIVAVVATSDKTNGISAETMENYQDSRINQLNTDNVQSTKESAVDSRISYPVSTISNKNRISSNSFTTSDSSELKSTTTFDEDDIVPPFSSSLEPKTKSGSAPGFEQSNNNNSSSYNYTSNVNNYSKINNKYHHSGQFQKKSEVGAVTASYPSTSTSSDNYPSRFTPSTQLSNSTPVPFTSSKFEDHQRESSVPFSSNQFANNSKSSAPFTSSQFDNNNNNIQKSTIPPFSSSKFATTSNQIDDIINKSMIPPFTLSHFEDSADARFTKSVSFDEDDAPPVKFLTTPDVSYETSIESSPQIDNAHIESYDLLQSQVVLAEILDYKTLTDLERIRLRPFLDIWDEIEQDISDVKLNGIQSTIPRTKLQSMQSGESHPVRMMNSDNNGEDNDDSYDLFDIEQGQKSSNGVAGRKSSKVGVAGAEIETVEDDYDDSSYEMREMLFKRRLLYCLLCLVCVAIPIAIGVSVKYAGD